MFKILQKILIAFLSLSIIIGLFSFVFTSDIYAAESFCFNPIQCNEDGSGCQNLSDAVHRAILTSDGTVTTTNGTVYIAECITIGTDNTICTTGSNENDAYVYGDDTLIEQLSDQTGYEFRGLTDTKGNLIDNKMPASTAFSNNLVWHSYTSSSLDRYFVGYYYADPTPSITLGQGGDQLANVTFDLSGSDKRCVPITWDPYGRVFDSQTLEPVKDVKVSLFGKQKTGVYKLITRADTSVVAAGLITNPYTTDNDGQFSFYVADGTYKLSISGIGYAFPSTKTINGNYSKMYSELYPQTGEEIVEKGAMEHRDIPVDSSLATVTPLKFISATYQGDKAGNVYVDGRVSHPLSTVSVYSTMPSSTNSNTRIRHRLIETLTTDAYGRFSIKVNQTSLNYSKGELFGELEITKSKIFTDTLTNKIIKQFEPIPLQLDGVAYDNSGQSLANTTVGLYYGFSKKPYYTTTTDNQGRFNIPASVITTMPYSIKYSKSGKSVNVSTSKFLADNKSYLTENKINSFLSKNTTKSTANYSLLNRNNSNSGTNVVKQGVVESKVNTLTKNSKMVFLAVAIMFFLVLAVFGMIFFYRKKSF